MRKVILQRKWLGTFWYLADLLAAEGAFFTAIYLRYGELYPIPPFFSRSSYLFYSALLIFLYLPVLWAFRVGRERLPSVAGLFKSVFVLAVLVNVLPFYFKDFAFSRYVFLVLCGLSFIYGLLWRFAVQLMLDQPWCARLLRERVILAAGAGRLKDLAASLESVSTSRFEIVGLAAEGSERPAEETAREARPVVPFDETAALASASGADVVFLDPEGINPARWLSLAETLAEGGVGMRLLSGLEFNPPLVVGSGPISAAETVDFAAGPITGFPALVKRALDISVSLALLVLASPLMFLIVLAIRLKSPGPVIYAQERVGRQGLTFEIYKFRTMVHGAELETGPVWSSGDDRRIVPGIGHFLRRTGLDELPQFWNVLTGRMSLVGPRPERAYFFDAYPELYRGRLAVRPGLTGLAQVSCRQTTSVAQKVRHDLYYIRNYSLALDIEILWQTSVMLVVQEWKVLFRRDAGQPEEASSPDKGKAGNLGDKA